MKRTAFAVLAWAGAFLTVAPAAVVTFEDLGLAPDSYEDGSNLSGSFTSSGVSFGNAYNAEYFSWSGFAYSSTTDTATMDYSNQYSSVTGAGSGSATYGVGYYSNGYEANPTISFGSLVTVSSIDVTNTALSALAMQNSLYGSKIFGGTEGTDPDYLLLTIEGYAGGVSQGTVNFYLANFLAADNADDYIVSQWTSVNLSGLGAVDSLQFTMSSSDVGDFGINTPTYFAVDNLQFVPEPSTALLSLVGLAPLLRRKRVR
ncbi:MAG: DUF4465 domain-containing protein [Luteolibacter sp.]